MNPALRELVRWLAEEAIAEAIAAGAREPSDTIAEPTPEKKPAHDRRHLRPVQLRPAEPSIDR